MSVPHMYHLCNRYRGKPVKIRTRDGRVHYGVITNVTKDKVYIRPPGNPRRNLGGFGYGYYGYGWGWRGLAYGIALGLIVSLAFFPFFWC